MGHTLRITGIWVVGLLASGLTYADAKHFYFQREQRRQQAVQEALQNNLFGLFPIVPPQNGVSAGTFNQRIDHDSSVDQRTFKQRYYIYSDAAASAQSPVLYYICGEATCDSTFIMGAILQHAKQLKAHVIALEHRYYGKSIPTPDLSTENLRYLTVDYALKDLAAFQLFAQSDLGASGKVVTIGGSYPGSLSAFYRLEYPQLSRGGLASSAPVMAKANFDAYDAHVAKVAGPACAKALRDITADIESRLKDPAQSAATKQLFEAGFSKNDTDFLYLVADIAAAAVQYGDRDRLCDQISGPSATGLNALSLLKVYAGFAKELYKAWGMTAYEFSLESAFSENPADYLNGFGTRAWLYQSCTEFGFFQNAHPDPLLTTRSPRIDASYHQNLCARLFGSTPFVDEDRTNDRYYRKLLDPATASQILYTNGEQDPWNRLSVHSALGNDSNPKNTAIVIPGAAHCDDMRRETLDDSTELKEARRTFLDSARQWIQNP